MSRGERFPAIASLFLLLLLPFLLQDPASGDMVSADDARAETLSLFASRPVPVSFLLFNPVSPGDVLVLAGSRPAGDRPRAALRGRRGSEADWVLEDDSAAVWVTGVPAPEAGRQVLLAARAEGDDRPLAGLGLAIAADAKGTTVIRPGELAYSGLGGTRSYSCSAEVSGDAAEVSYTKDMQALILRGVKPGTVVIRIQAHWWNRPGPELLKEYVLEVR